MKPLSRRLGYANVLLAEDGPCIINRSSLGYYSVNKAEIRTFTSWLGKRSYRTRLKRFGIERLQEIARENGKKGGRPKGSGKEKMKVR